MIRATLRITAGISLVIVGLLGLLLPIMPGWIFLIPGLVLLGDYFPPIRRLVEWAKRKMTGPEGATGSPPPSPQPPAPKQ
jgi:hypothetical protein